MTDLILNKTHRRNASKEHQEICQLVKDRFHCEPVMIRGNQNITGFYFPDLKDETTDFEVEIMPKLYLAKKEAKWDKKRKRILIIATNNFCNTNFDEIYACNFKTFFKLK